MAPISCWNINLSKACNTTSLIQIQIQKEKKIYQPSTAKTGEQNMCLIMTLLIISFKNVKIYFLKLFRERKVT